MCDWQTKLLISAPDDGGYLEIINENFVIITCCKFTIPRHCAPLHLLALTGGS